MKKTPTTLIIMDGWGQSASGAADPGDAVRSARTPRMDAFCARFAHTALSASGPDAGLPEGQAGDSVSGHLNIAAGRVVNQPLNRLHTAVRDGSFFRSRAFLRAVESCRISGTALHLAGLLSDGGVHSHMDHLFALLRLAKERGVERVWLHLFLDGRDVPSGTAAAYLRRTETVCQELGVGKIATIMGRFYAMDRDSNWDLTGMAYDAMVYGQTDTPCRPPLEAVRAAQAEGVADEYMEPVVCDPDGTVSDQDSLILFNFRPDRIHQLARAFADPGFDGFTRQLFPLTIAAACDCGVPGVLSAFPPEPVPDTLAKYLSGLKLSQIRIAETAATAFYGVGTGGRLPGEDLVLIPSPRISAWQLQPELSAREVCRACVERIESGAYDACIVNFANCDLVGHTGSLKAAVKAVETVDECVGNVADATLNMGGIAIITASHGNAERMLCPDGSPNPANTTSPVPFILCGAAKRLRPGTLADIAPTMLDVMGLAAPDTMEGKTLIVE